MKGLGKYGITGNTGLGVGGFFHVSASYDSNGMVFVACEEDMMDWKRVPLEEAKEKNLQIINCCMCNKPAVSLDHHYPYLIDDNRCVEHYGVTLEGEG